MYCTHSILFSFLNRKKIINTKYEIDHTFDSLKLSATLKLKSCVFNDPKSKLKKYIQLGSTTHAMQRGEGAPALVSSEPNEVICCRVSETVSAMRPYIRVYHSYTNAPFTQ